MMHKRTLFISGEHYDKGNRSLPFRKDLRSLAFVVLFAALYCLFSLLFYESIHPSLAEARETNARSVSGNKIENIALTGDGHYTCTFDGVEHDLILDLPEDSDGNPVDPKGSPLILMLHGYGSTAEAFRRDTGFHEDANKKGYTVVYVTGAPNPGDATSAAGWNYDAIDSGNKDVDFLKALVSYMEDQYQTDRTRRFAIGFSNGGFMCHRLAIEAADTFSAVVSVSGMMPEHIWAERPDTLHVSVFQLTGEKDDTIPKNSDGSARYAKAPAIEEVIEYYASANSLKLNETQTAGKDSVLTKYEKESSLSDDAAKLRSDPETKDRKDRAGSHVWHLVVKDGRHSWSAENVTGINTNQLILEFLSEMS